MGKNAQHQDSFDGLRVMKKSAQEPAKGDPTVNLRVMRSHDPTIGLRVMRSDPMMNLRVMRSSQNQNSERNAQLLRTANNMNMRIMLRNDLDLNMDMRMRRSSGANNQKYPIDMNQRYMNLGRTTRGNPSMGLRVMKKRSM